MGKITVLGSEINIVNHTEHDYISLSDMVKNTEDGGKLIENWLRNKNTLEFLAVWEKMENPNFNSLEFEGIRTESGTNRFLMSVSQWNSRTNAIGIFAKAGRYGGTYAHKDIAFEFGTWISPEFKLLLVKEFQRLKDEESKRLDSEWDYRRFLAKTNYVIHTDAVKDYRIPRMNITKEKEWLVYADEADILNVALFGFTAKAWKEANTKAALDGKNIRDLADMHQLIVLSNLESLNGTLIKGGMDRQARLRVLKDSAQTQLDSLRKSTYTLDKIQSPFLPKYTAKTEQISLSSHESTKGDEPTDPKSKKKKGKGAD